MLNCQKLYNLRRQSVENKYDDKIKFLLKQQIISVVSKFVGLCTYDGTKTGI